MLLQNNFKVQDMTRNAGGRLSGEGSTHPDSKADEAPAWGCHDLQSGVGLDEAHKELPQLDVMPTHKNGMHSQRFAGSREQGRIAETMQMLHTRSGTLGHKQPPAIIQGAHVFKDCCLISEHVHQMAVAGHGVHLRNFLMLSVP